MGFLVGGALDIYALIATVGKKFFSGRITPQENCTKTCVIKGGDLSQ